ncbi:TonB-dependent receptor [Dyella sp. LX-66]|uniref:TonB-dependent receptor n=2 Tax=Dyella TaxID=231454 RepID=UPI001BDF894B|nr:MULTISPECIES: TonB-dependent receptor [unclassified Dyella]MBT2116542.1 TonB-dependent receptor [Dyella sp. LX-1]MBT2140515.1 TonB-dependent receptor [Dyella sp. LX-66]
MSHRRTMLAASIIASLCMAGAIHAQDATTQSQTTPNPNAQGQSSQSQADQKKAVDLQGVTVTGIRASLQQSLDTKRNADAIVEAVTAEDIGKFPNTNVAEAMALIPGVTIDRQFGQGDRVSIDGTDPSLNLTFLNGQPISQTPWQYGAQPNRGFDFTMLAPEIVGRLEVYKSPEARLTEGSLGGTVLLHTLQPLDLAPNTWRGSFSLNYNDQAENHRPSGSLLYSWHNDAKTFGVIASAQHFEEKIDRQGIEIFGYHPVSDYASSPAVAAGIANGSLNPNAKVPDEINSAFFQQERKRDTVTLGFQLRPTSNWDVDFNSLYIRENFNNWNQSLYPFTHATPGQITSFTQGANGIVTGGHVCGKLDDPTCGDIAQGTFDSNIRHSVVRTTAFDLKSNYRGDGWTLGGAVGYSKANNNDMSQVAMEPVYGGGYSWDINRGFQFDSPALARNPANWHMGDTPGMGGWPGNYGVFHANAKDTYGQLDFTKDFDSFVNTVLVGARYNRHEESMEQHVYGPNGPISLANLGTSGYTDTLGGFSGMLPDAASHIQPDRDAEWNWVRSTNGGNDDPGSYLNGTWKIVEKTTAAYLQADFGSGPFRGNVGVRYVHTVDDASGFNYSGVPVYPAPAGWWQTTSTTHNNWLPSLNVSYDLTESVVLRFAAAKVISRAPYNMQVNNLFLNDSVLTGSGGNSKLDPYKSSNFSASAEWYFAPQSVLALTGFYKKIDNYIFVDSAIEQHYNSAHDNDPTTFARLVANGQCTANGFCGYDISRPRNVGGGKVKGVSLSYQQPFADTGFGVVANYTYADATLDSGGALPYSSKNSYSLSPYYEKGPYSARLTYNWRSSYLAGGYIAGAPPATTGSYKDLGATIGYKLNDNISFTLDGMNLLNSKYVQYLQSESMPLNKYTTGRRYMLAAHVNF